MGARNRGRAGLFGATAACPGRQREMSARRGGPLSGTLAGPRLRMRPRPTTRNAHDHAVRQEQARLSSASRLSWRLLSRPAGLVSVLARSLQNSFCVGQAHCLRSLLRFCEKNIDNRPSLTPSSCETAPAPVLFGAAFGVPPCNCTERQPAEGDCTARPAWTHTTQNLSR